MALPSGQAADKAFGTNLKTIRVDKSLTQADIAEQMTRSGYKWHAATVYKVENGDRQIQLGEAIELARILGHRLEDLAGPQDDVKNRSKLTVVYRELLEIGHEADRFICEFLEGCNMLGLLMSDIPNTQQLIEADALDRMRRVTDKESELFTAMNQAHLKLFKYLHERR